jgi:hypothetical protein
VDILHQELLESDSDLMIISTAAAATGGITSRSDPNDINVTKWDALIECGVIGESSREEGRGG